MSKLSHAFTTFIRNELRLAVALGVLLLVLVGLSLAVDSSYKFDFGDGSASGLEPDYLAVDGGASTYPVAVSGLQYGWLDSVIVFSNGAAVSSKLKRDGNKGVDPARFRITGLANNNYRLSLVSGSLDSAFSTKVMVNNRSFSTTTQINQWNTLTFDAEAANGTLELIFERAGANLWGTNSLVITPSPILVVKPTFDVIVQPASHTVRVGGTAVYRISVNPLSGYASLVNLSITGLVGNMTAQFTPASGLLPLVADLTISSTATTPLTQYDFVVTAKGKDVDAYTVNQSISLIITNSPTAPTTAKPDTVIGGSDSTTSSGTNGTTSLGGLSLDEINLPPRTPADVKQEQAMVDDYAKVEAKKLASTRDILEIGDISTINNFALEPPAVDKTLFGSSLQYLTAAGIIGTTVDSAPPAPAAAPKPMGFWEKFFKDIVKPTL